MNEFMRIGDICDILNGYAFKSSKYVADGIRVIRITNVQKGFVEDTNPQYYPVSEQREIEKYMLCEGDLLMSLTGNVGRVGLLSAEMLPAALNQRVACIRIRNPAVIYKPFLFHLLNSDYFENKCILASQGVAQKNMSTEWLKEYPIPSFSMDKQMEIASIFDKIDDLIAHRKEQVRNMDQAVKSRFIELFGDPVINPKGFPCYTVGEVIDFQGGSQPDKKYFEYEASPDNIRLIQIRDYKSDKYITYIPKTMAKRFCTADDIMIGRYGPPIFQILKGIEGSFNVALMKATPKMGNREFVRQFLKQDCLLEYLEGLSKRTAGQDGIQMDKLKAYPFPYPPMELQEQFAAFVEQTDKSKFYIVQMQILLRLLIRAIQQKTTEVLL